MTNPPRQFTLKDRRAFPERSRRDHPLNLAVSFAGEAQACSHAGGMPADYQVLPEDGFEQENAAREWLKHVEVGRIGGA